MVMIDDEPTDPSITRSSSESYVEPICLVDRMTRSRHQLIHSVDTYLLPMINREAIRRQ